MPPAQQRLGSHDRIVSEAYLRLKINLELILHECPPELIFQPAARLRLRAQHRQEKAISSPAVRLCLIEGEIRIGDQFIDGGAVIGSDGDAGAAGEMQNVVMDAEWLLQT